MAGREVSRDGVAGVLLMAEAERQGYIVLEPHLPPDEPRSTSFVLTEKGEAFCDEYDTDVNGFAHAFLREIARQRNPPERFVGPDGVRATEEVFDEITDDVLRMWGMK